MTAGHGSEGRGAEAADAAGRADGASPAGERRSRSGWIAALLVLALLAWMGSGYVLPAGEDAPAPAAGEARRDQPVTVEVMASRARPVTRFLVSEGQAAPQRLTQVRSEAAGIVESIAVEKGAPVERGAVIAVLGAAERSARKAEAEAELARRRRDFESVQSLYDRGYATRAQLEETRSALAAAEAELAEASETLQRTEIVAPFTGVLDDLTIEEGEFVSAGQDVGVMVDVDPLVVEIEVPQQSRAGLARGDRAEVSFITGETREGTIRFVATNARPATRTFPVEITVDNPGRAIAAGISARVRIPTGQTPAHFVSPAVLSLGADGALGVKTVTEEAAVAFYPVELVRAETGGIWIAGLPDQAGIITVGQGFVSEGERVDPVAAEEAPVPPGGPADAPEIAARGAPGSLGGGPAPDGGGPSMPLRDIEAALRQLGYAAGQSDGDITQITRAAIREFQRRHGLDETGTVDSALIAKLREALAESGDGG